MYLKSSIIVVTLESYLTTSYSESNCLNSCVFNLKYEGENIPRRCLQRVQECLGIHRSILKNPEFSSNSLIIFKLYNSNYIFKLKHRHYGVSWNRQILKHGTIMDRFEWQSQISVPTGA